jgi:ATP-binding cassette subfamily B protein
VGIDFVRHCADRTVPAPALPFFVPADATDKAVFIWLGAGILLSAVLRATLAFVFGLVSVRFLHGRIVVNLRSQVFAKLQQLSFRFFDSNASGSIINRVTSDAHAIRLFIEGVVLQLAIIALTLAACAASAPTGGSRWPASRSSRSRSGSRSVSHARCVRPTRRTAN